MSTPLSVVVAADSSRAPALLDILHSGGFELRLALVTNLSELVHAMAETRWDVILLAPDGLPGLDLERVLAMAELLRTPVLVIAGSADPTATRDALRAGAADVIWPAQLDRLPLAIERVLLQAARARAWRPAAPRRTASPRFSYPTMSSRYCWTRPLGVW